MGHLGPEREELLLSHNCGANVEARFITVTMILLDTGVLTRMLKCSGVG